MSTHSRNLLLIAILVLLLALGVYWATLMPGIGLIDSGELALAAWLPGNAHPPGTPLYVILGWLFTRLPIGTVALRLNGLSALCGAVAATLVVVATWLMRRAGQREEGPLAYLPPLVAGLSFAFSGSLWLYAVVTEVYTLHAALLAGGVAALLAWRREPGELGARSNRWLYVAALLMGLAFTVHSATVLTFVPAILYLVIGRDWEALRTGRAAGGRVKRGAQRSPAGPRKGKPGRARDRHTVGRPPLADQAPVSSDLESSMPPRRLPSPRQAFVRMALNSSACVLAGLLAYAYLPLRAAGQPLLNWGDPGTPLTFWWHVTGKWYQLFFETAQTSIFDRVAQYFVLLAQEHVYVGLIAAALGAWSLWRRDRALLVFGLLVLLGDLLLFAAYDIQQDRQAYVVPALLAVALLIGEGAAWLLERAQHLEQAGRAAVVGASVLAVAVPVLALAGNYAVNDHSRDWLAEDFARNMLRSIEQHGVLLSSEWDATISPLLYVQHVLGERPDVTVIDVNLMRRSWYVNFVRQADPELYAAVAPEYAVFEQHLVAWERDACDRTCASEIQGRFETLVNAMVSQATAAGRPVYLTRDLDAAVTRDPHRTWMVVAATMTRVPQGLAYRLYADSAFHPEPAPTLELRGLSDGTVPLPPGSIAAGLPGHYIELLTLRAHYLLGGGDTTRARTVYQQLLQVDPRNAEALEATR